MQYHKHVGIIINRHSVSDADRFLTILTRDQGKISVYARSVRSLKSKRASSLDLFSKISFEVFDKSGHRTLTHVDLLDAYRPGKRKLSDISRLFQIGELVDALVPEDDPQSEVYDLLETALASLSRFETPDYLYRFKKKLLQLLGFWDSELTDTTVDSYIESLINRSLRVKIK